MADVTLTTAPAGDRTFVRLRIAMTDADQATRVLGLPPEPLTSRAGDPTALWIAPDQWLITSSTVAADVLIERIEAALANFVCNATNASDALACFTVSGSDASSLLAMASGVDFDNRTFPTGRCVRTRFAKVAVVVHHVDTNRFELIFDRSAAHYLEQWLRRALADAAA
jgi:heterotetrameric sarcosine oxidase gamma subunit